MTPLERAGFLAHARTRGFQRRVEAAQDMLAEHPNDAVSVSWGKDSTVLLHLAAQIRPDVAAIHGRYARPEGRLPDTDVVRDQARTHLPQVRYREVICPSEWDLYLAQGFFLEPTTAAQRQGLRQWAQGFHQAMRRAITAVEASGVFLGLRAEESHARRRYLWRYGPTSITRDGAWRCCPLSQWIGRDIWAYLVAHDLPWLHIYDAAADRTRARSDMVFASGGTGGDAIRRHGAWYEWRQAYPEHFAIWQRQFPEMMRWL